MLLLFCLPSPGQTALRPSGTVPEYHLEVSFDLPRGKIKGQAVIQASPGRKLVHQWFGCAVSPDFARGNWSEGLATYFSVHLQAEGKNAAWIYRRRLLAEFQKQQPKIMEFALHDFTVGVGPPSRSVGYDKGALVFHMLRRQG